MSQYVSRANLSVASELAEFVEAEALPGLHVSADQFWKAMASCVDTFTNENQALLDEREALQKQIDDWHIARRGQPHDAVAYQAFLAGIGYSQDEPDDFTIETKNVDDEIALISGPQLVVPIKNARYAINAANARWGSFYDALYGTNAIMEAYAEKGYDPVRGAHVIAYAKRFLDETFPLQSGQWANVTSLSVKDGALLIELGEAATHLVHPKAFKGYGGASDAPSNILLVHNRLHADILIDPKSEIGRNDPANISDIMLESAVTTIMDCEDSVAAVDGEEKVECYRNMLGLMRGDLTQDIEKGGRRFTRQLNPDRCYRRANGDPLILPGLSTMLIRNVGHLMRNPAIRDAQGNDIFEGLLDTFMTALLSQHDLNKPKDAQKNSPAESVYIVKPKMHGPKEVAFAGRVFDFAEDKLGLVRNTLKIGIMDEERRTSVNLKACIKAVEDRVIFVNTGFLDRTGDEIHTSMEAGPMLRKADIKTQPWLTAYENRNVDYGLMTGFKGRAQIGKGMWPKPDEMADMMASKIDHPKAGADCAWAPSPTAATLHVLHYHKVDVDVVQDDLKFRALAPLSDLLDIPLSPQINWSEEDIKEELDNNIQGILGYVVRWVDQGIGCSKVPDIFDVGLMEDRATLRISSQHVANWLYHDICSEEQVRDSLQRMAVIVDRQNAGDPDYRSMSDDFENNIAFQAASDLIFEGRRQPSGYTEPILHAARLKLKVQGGQ